MQDRIGPYVTHRLSSAPGISRTTVTLQGSIPLPVHWLAGCGNDHTYGETENETNRPVHTVWLSAMVLRGRLDVLGQDVPGDKATGIELQSADHHSKEGSFGNVKKMGEVSVGYGSLPRAGCHTVLSGKEMGRGNVWSIVLRTGVGKVKRIQSH